MIFEMGDEIKYYKPMIIELNKMIFHIKKQIYHSDTITSKKPWKEISVTWPVQMYSLVTWKIPPLQVFIDIRVPLYIKDHIGLISKALSQLWPREES